MMETKEKFKEFSTCLENANCAELMQKMMGSQGIGSICAQIMKQAGEKDGKGCCDLCAGMMKAMSAKHEGVKQQFKETKKEA